MCVDMVLWLELLLLLRDLDRVLPSIGIHSFGIVVYVVDGVVCVQLVKRKLQCCVYIGDSCTVRNIYSGLAWK